MSLRVDWIPSAMVVVGSLVGLGAFAGSAGRVAAPDAPGAPARLETNRDRAAESVRAGHSNLVAQVTASSRAAIEAMRPELIRQCWEPSAAWNPEPEHIQVGFSLAFRQDGTVAASGILVAQGEARPDMTDCLAMLVHGLKIPPPGRSISIEARVQLP